MSSAQELIRPLVRNLHPYVPGEQPKIKGLIKLNTNENPYPPSPKVLRAIRNSVDQRLRLYPNPAAETLREKLARFHRCAPENIIVGNGSDELLALAVRCFVEPGQGTVQYFTPSYSLYPVLAQTHGAATNPVPLAKDFSLPKHQERWNSEAALTFVTTPNAPSGRGYSTRDLEALCNRQRGVTVLDEAYVDFGAEHALELGLKYPHVLITRTFSKAYSLCFLRVGYMVGNPDLISALHKMRDSYNVNGLAQVAAAATLDDLRYYRRNFRRVIATRKRLSTALEKLGFDVLPSHTNFILVRPPGSPASEWLGQLRARKILVRWFGHRETQHHLRISIGTDSETDALLRAVNDILRKCK
jgi:histidinol-phosphate aminotransferase